MKDEFGFDVGTSPHGLSVGRRERIRKQAEGSGGSPSAKPLLTLLEHDRSLRSAGRSPAAVREAASAGQAKGKRLANQSMTTPPEGAKPEIPGFPLGFGRSVVPVSSVAREWGISPRRVRVMLAEGRLAGRMLDNGYWEVFYPYQYVFGTRGPAMKRQQKQERRTA
jgi:hypothetical protein